jgi:hypothetical protein
MNSVDSIFEELESILANEYTMHEHLFNAATEVNAAIIKNDLNALQQQNAALDEQVFQIGQLEERRMECCARLSHAIGLSGERVRLAAIIEKAPPFIREKLGMLHKALKNAIAGIRRITTTNRTMIEKGLAMVQGQFAIIMQSGSKFANYQHTGGRATATVPYNPLFNRTI